MSLAGSSYNTDPELEWRAFYLIEVMKYLGYPVRITESFRSSERQQELYAVGRTQPGAILTHARPGSSPHEFGRAIDITFLGPGYSAPDSWWNLAGEVGEWLGLRWGGRFKGFRDRPHFEI